MTSTNQDFFVDKGVIAYRKRGRQLVSASYELIRGTLPAIAVAFDEGDADPESYLAQGREVAVGAYIQFCSSCLYEPACAYYGASQASLFVDALFARFYKGHLPADELFQLYLDYPIFPDDQKRKAPMKPGRTPGGRIFQFICDVIGHPDFAPMVILNTTAVQLMLDGKSIFDADDPERAAGELVETLFPRLMKRLEAFENKEQPLP